MFRYCPACASERISFKKGKVFTCPDCGFTYYHNTAAATACIVRTGAGLLFLVRGKEPAKGKLDLPGGFVDPGEGAMDGLRREFVEELGWDPLAAAGPAGESGTKPQEAFTLFASFPNKYPYKNIPYNTCDLFFYIDAPTLSKEDLRLEAAEIAEVRFIRPGDINYEDLAFESAKQAVKTYLQRHCE
ncbi:MAG: NUDIX domain-containing protein [Spirochaetaceae bacterium]|jgi:ADP-ribose pyrophosphatase YjhB (NUDIX family)|nr:NUDIX domain-containing protein [Spirochaetaceae bacterium]